MTMQFSFQPGVNWTVNELTIFIQELLNVDELHDIWVTGEVSNATRSTAGHFYFTMKDEKAALRCVMWRQQASAMVTLPRDGDLIQAHGYIGVYPPNGQYQFYTDSILPLGSGALFQEFLRLKTKLEKEGLFDTSRKKSIPQFPHRIGIVTSLNAAALQDILNTLRRRYPLAEVIIAPALVQGEDAPASLIRALGYLDKIIKPDVIILARGGGSLEDLWAFNDEKLIRVIAALNTPIVTGIGHETDFTLADFAGDLRAPTPTAAAELITPNIQDLSQDLRAHIFQLEQAILSTLNHRQTLYKSLTHRLKMKSPIHHLMILRQRLDEIQHRFNLYSSIFLEQRKNYLLSLDYRLQALNPNSILSRGYAVISSFEGVIIRSINQVEKDELLSAQLADGSMNVKVIEIQGNA